MCDPQFQKNCEVDYPGISVSGIREMGHKPRLKGKNRLIKRKKAAVRSDNLQRSGSLIHDLLLRRLDELQPTFYPTDEDIIGRMREKNSRVSQDYRIEVMADDKKTTPSVLNGDVNLKVNKKTSTAVFTA